MSAEVRTQNYRMLDRFFLCILLLPSPKWNRKSELTEN